VGLVVVWVFLDGGVFGGGWWFWGLWGLVCSVFMCCLWVRDWGGFGGVWGVCGCLGEVGWSFVCCGFGVWCVGLVWGCVGEGWSGWCVFFGVFGGFLGMVFVCLVWEWLDVGVYGFLVWFLGLCVFVSWWAGFVDFLLLWLGGLVVVLWVVCGRCWGCWLVGLIGGWIFFLCFCVWGCIFWFGWGCWCGCVGW